PDNRDLLCVKAEYKTGNVKREAKASFYNHSLVVRGFGSAGAYQVKLYAVNNAEQMSEPVAVMVHPLDPPIKKIFSSITTSTGFGGMLIKFSNPTTSAVSIHVITPDTLGVMSTAKILYTKKKNGTFAVRGFNP